MVIYNSKNGHKNTGKFKPIKETEENAIHSCDHRPIYSLILGTKVMIVLNTDQVVKDLLDKRSNIYSSRPDMYLGQIISGGLRVLLMVSRNFLTINHV